MPIFLQSTTSFICIILHCWFHFKIHFHARDKQIHKNLSFKVKHHKGNLNSISDLQTNLLDRAQHVDFSTFSEFQFCQINSGF